MSAEGSSSSGSATDSTEKQEFMKKASELLAQGKRNMVCGEVPKAITVFDEAVQMLAKEYGELSRNCADAYFSYGSALLELGRMETNVLGVALDGVDVDAKEDETESEQFEKPAEDGNEREKVRTEVYEAMAEGEREQTVAEKEKVEEVSKEEEKETKPENKNDVKEMKGDEDKKTVEKMDTDMDADKPGDVTDSKEVLMDIGGEANETKKPKDAKDETEKGTVEKMEEGSEAKSAYYDKDKQSDEKIVEKSEGDTKSETTDKADGNVQSVKKAEAVEGKEGKAVSETVKEMAEKSIQDTKAKYMDKETEKTEDKNKDASSDLSKDSKTQEESQSEDTTTNVLSEKNQERTTTEKEVETDSTEKTSTPLVQDKENVVDTKKNGTNESEKKEKTEDDSEKEETKDDFEKEETKDDSEKKETKVECENKEPKNKSEIEEESKDDSEKKETKDNSEKSETKKNDESENKEENKNKSEIEEETKDDSEKKETKDNSEKSETKKDDESEKKADEKTGEDIPMENDEGADDGGETAEAEDEQTGEESQEGDESQEDGEDKDEDVPNFQLAWEYLDLAKVIYLKSDVKDEQLKAAECYIKLGEVSMETEQHATAAEDLESALKIQQKHLAAEDRLIAETHYQLGLAYGLGKEFERSIEHYQLAISVIEAKIASLNKLVEENEKDADNKENREVDELQTYKDEIKELQELIPEMKNKIEDTKSEVKDMEKMKEMAKELLGLGGAGISTRGFGSPTKKSVDAQSSAAGDVDENGEKKPKDISCLVRKKRKPEEDAPAAAGEVKKMKQDGDMSAPMTNGTTDNVKTNGTAETKETALKEVAANGDASEVEMEAPVTASS